MGKRYCVAFCAFFLLLNGCASELQPLPEGCDEGPLPRPRPNCMPEASASSGDLAEDCVARINQLRWECQCLPPLQRWTEGEDCADEHANYDQAQNSAHLGFQQRICEPRAFAQNECPGWPADSQNACLQQMWNEGPGDDFLAHGHYINMASMSYSKVACGISDDKTWSVQNFR